MAKKSRGATIRMTRAAEADFKHILRWTANRFSNAHARIYARTMDAAIESLIDGELGRGGVKARDDIGQEG